MNIFLLAICLGILSSLSMFCIIILCVKHKYYTDIILFFIEDDRDNNRDNILPIRNITNINVRPKKEVELTHMKKYVVVQSPDQQFSIGVEIEPLSI
jgi:hypothetical protein